MNGRRRRLLFLVLVLVLYDDELTRARVSLGCDDDAYDLGVYVDVHIAGVNLVGGKDSEMALIVYNILVRYLFIKIVFLSYQ